MIFRKHIEQLPQQLTDCNSSSRAPSLQAFQPMLDIIPTPSAAESTTHKANPRWDEASLAEEKANALHPSMNSDKIPQIQHKSDLHINAKEKWSNPQATSQNPPPKSPSLCPHHNIDSRNLLHIRKGDRVHTFGITPRRGSASSPEQSPQGRWNRLRFIPWAHIARQSVEGKKMKGNEMLING